MSENSIGNKANGISDSNGGEMAELDLVALNKFSRQNATFGAETTAKLIKMKVIIFGLRGVGAETAKNLALQGVGSITLVDNSPISVQDLGLNFFFTEEDISQSMTRATPFAPKLRELNPMCDVKVDTPIILIDPETFFTALRAVKPDDI